MSFNSRSSFAPPLSRASPLSQAPPIDRVSLLDRHSAIGVSHPEGWRSRRSHLPQSFSAPVISSTTSFRSGLRSEYIAPLAESALERLTSSPQSWSGDWSSRFTAPSHRSFLDERSPLPGITGDACSSVASRHQHESRRERIIPIEREKFVLPSISGSSEALVDSNDSTPKMTMSGRSLNGQSNNDSARHSTLEENRGGSRSGAYSVGSSRNSRGLTGLRNIGNTCYMNAVLQCLSCTKQLLELVLEERLSSDISPGSSRGALIRAFSSLIQDMWSTNTSRGRVTDTENLKNQLDKFAPRFSGHDQQDAQEFLRYLLEGLHQDINKARTRSKITQTSIDENMSNDQIAMESWRRQLLVDNSRLVGVFMGQLQSTLTCGSCHNSSVTFDAFWDLSLPIPSSGSSHLSGFQEIELDDCLAAFTGEEVLDSVDRPFCSKCGRRQTSSKSLRLHRLPPVLVLHLKRFGNDPNTGQHCRLKITSTVHFPLSQLSLDEFCTSPHTQRYDLYAVVNHQGSQSSGHYTAYCRHPHSNQWYLFDDTSVRLVDSPASVVSQRAYILFYERVTDTTSYL